MAHGEKLRKFWSKVKALFTKIDKYILDHIDVAITITTKIKEALQSPAAEILVQIIPGTWDDLAREKAIVALSETLKVMAIVDECQHKESLSERLECYLSHLRQLPPLVQHALLSKIAATITAQLDGNKHEEHLYDLWVQQNYSISKV